MPIYHQMTQGTQDWRAARLGLPTASEFHRIVTPKGKLSAQAAEYLHRLIAELMLGRPLGDETGTKWMERGQDIEANAVSSYEFDRNCETQLCGFVTNDAGTYGCSPDRLVGDSGILEIKSPSPGVHIRYLLTDSIDTEKLCQVQGQLLVTERQWVDLVSYHPEMPLVVVRVERDEEYIDLLRQALDAFAAQLIEARKLLEERYGPFPEPTAAPVVVEDSFGVSDADVDQMISQGAIKGNW